MFDIPYLNTRALINNIQLNLGRNGSDLDIETNTRELRKDGGQTYTYHRINCFGRDMVDTFFLAIKYDIGKKYVSYGLKSIIKQEGLEKTGRQHYDASQIKVNWANLDERAKIIQYAEEDSEDPIKLFDLMVPSFFYITPYIPKTFQVMTESATGSQINSLMVRSYLQKGMSVAEGSDAVDFEGAVSFGNPGIYDNVFKVDVASLYPSIMRHYNIFPKGKDYNGNFLKMLEYFTIERLKNKKLAKETEDRFYDDLQNAQKVVINSAYGFMGAQRLNYNYPHGAAETTRYGREIITKSVEWATGCTLEHVVSKVVNKGKPNQKEEYEWKLGKKVCEGNGYVISNCDTDSISFTTGNSLSVEERKVILADLNSNFPKSIVFEDDGYFTRAIILKAKNYILFDGKKIKIKGSGLKDQKKEPALKEMLDAMIGCLVNDKQPNMAGIYNQYIKEACGPQDIMRWSAKKTITKAVLNCATDPDARMNESKPYEAVKDIVGLQEGDKVYLYPCITHERIEQTEQKNGKIKEKHIKETGLKIASAWNGDEDNEKLVERVIATVEIFANVFDTNTFIDYSLKKNKQLLEAL
jgi:DNA polymerase elongation subunit (family B)